MEFLVTAVVIVLGIAFAAWVTRRLRGAVARVAWASLALHVVSAVGLVAVTRFYYGYGDMLAYHRVGVRFADELRTDFAATAPELLRLLLQMENNFIDVHGNGWSTGSLSALSGFLCFAFLDALTATGVALAVFSWWGKLEMAKAMARAFPAPMAPRLMAANLLLPSYVFWTSGLLKETLAVAGLGFLIAGTLRLVATRAPTSVLPLMAGAAVVGLIKPYLLFPYATAVGAMLYAGRRGGGGPLRFVVGAAAALLLLLGLGEVFPKYATDNLAEQVATMRELGQVHTGGSTFAVATSGGILGHVVSAPFALLTAFFRPMLFEASNPLILVSALEMTALLVFFVMALRRQTPRAVWQMFRAHPVVAFCAVYALVFGLAVGLSTTNLGTLSRYRAPMMPFYVVTLVVAFGLPQTARRRVAPARAAHHAASPSALRGTP